MTPPTAPNVPLQQAVRALGVPLRTAELEQFVAAFDTYTLPARAAVFAVGEAAPFLYYLEQGLAKHVLHLPSGEEQITCFFQEGMFVADVAAYQQQAPCSGSLIALEPLVVRRLGRDAFFGATDAQPTWTALLAEILARGLQEVERNTHNRIRFSATEYYHYLAQHRGDLLQRVALKELAAYLGIAPQSLSRIRAGKG